MGLDCVEITGSNQSNGCRLVVDHLEKDSIINDDNVDHYKAELRCLFDQVLSVFLKEIGCRGIARPVPVELGDRGSVDLFKLFWIVRDRGGYGAVSKNRLWSFVAEELGLDLGLSASVKLICCKYLNELQKWFRDNCCDRRLGNEIDNESEGNLRFLSSEFEKFGGLLFDEVGKKGVDNGVLKLESDTKNENFVDKCRVDEGGGKCPNDYEQKVQDDDDKICGSDSDDCVVLDPVSPKKKVESRKRKREHLLEMLKWVGQIVKNPDNPSFGKIPEPSKWKEYHGSKELWVWAISARDALLRRKLDLANADGSASQNKLKMHPSMYEDNINNTHQPIERLRCSERIPTPVKSRLCPCCNSFSASRCKLLNSQKVEAENCHKEQIQPNADLQNTKTRDDNAPFEEDSIEKHVPVGPLFQADVPEWTGVVSDSDPKWLGTKMWPSKCKTHDSQTYMNPIGRGRPKSCKCQLPCSVECVRFHIAEERLRLKLELGLVFYHWRFDRMGEEISLQWTDVEEKRFKDLMRSNHLARNKSLWALNWFPKKTRENLVSYYFNVFLVQQRGYQNRVTPKDIDSDDDESEFGSFGSGFGYGVVKVSGSEILTCSENKQCTDFD